MDKPIHMLRRQATALALLEAGAGDDPLALFETWVAEAREGDKQEEPTACSLATVREDGGPAVRMVLLKALEDGAFVFYTPTSGRKGKELSLRPQAAMCFYWADLHRQVRVEGDVTPVSGPVADKYFATRPRESQIGAWASPQSEVITDRSVLDERIKQWTGKFEGSDVPRPDAWGGFALHPNSIEFWQGRASRLHDRLLYERNGDAWTRRRLAP
ncbi:MAG: pyridoxamine 5'-phosphate oxidase [Planctomycetes bacterium]|nr:pyridoxamine 5'-phosphate oxidase [Planctomycetota bacterium]